MGYDGKGQEVLNDKIAHRDLLKIYQNFVNIQKNTPLILEKFCLFEQELSVLVARNKNGEIACYDPLTNVHKSGILYRSFFPAKVGLEVKNNAKKIAKKIAESLDLVGVIAVEFFLVNGELLVNELAPRPHNSYHFSIDANFTSQFEQLIRAITNSKLGSTHFFGEGYMQNLLGKEIFALDLYQKNQLAKIHIYGKDQAVDGRKMGHVNILKKP